jgi:SAM-dependent methyltransferase
VTNALRRARRIAGIVRDRAKETAWRVHSGGSFAPGLCNICGSSRGFVHNTEYAPRESFFCRSCRSTSRDRMLIFSLGLCLGHSGPLRGWDEEPNVTLLETSGYRGHPEWLKRKFRYLNLIYGGVANKPYLLGDISHLGVRDSSFDAIISSDVFEHVRDDVSGFAEVARTLRPGGYLVLQVPRLGEAGETEVRVEVDGDQDIYVMPPEYHAEQTLVYRYYGNDLVERLSSVGLSGMLFTTGVPAHGISKQTVLIGQKAPYISVGLQLSQHTPTLVS